MAPAPSPAAATTTEEKGPILKLIVEKGPLTGQIFNFMPGSRIQIGRVVRGNTICIKDAGISSKHVLIHLESSSHPDPAPNLCRWTITDLASSNGTILNDTQLEPAKPSVLSDGDVIKIGELTSMKVKFEVTECGNEGNSGNARRNPRRGAVGRGKRVVELGAIDENSEVVLENEGCEMGKNDEGKVRGRRTRGSNKVSGNSCEEMEGKIDNAGKASLRRTRSSQKKENSGALEDGKEEIVGEVKGKGGRNVAVRRTRSSKEEEKLEGSEDLDGIGDEDYGQSLKEAGQRVGGRRTRSSRKVENLGYTELDLGVIEGRKTRKGTRGKKNVPLEPPEEDKPVKEMNLGHETCEERNEEDGVDGLVKERMNFEREGDAGVASTSGLKGSGVAGDGEEVPDLEKMTLGDWFDYLEIYLPKQIIDTTEKMIMEMKHKAVRLHEYMLQQKNAKEKDGVDIG